MIKHNSARAERPHLPGGHPAEALQAIPIFYSEELLADAHSFSPSADKPRHVLAAWQAAHLPMTFRRIRPATESDFTLAHDPAYVRGVLSCALPNGFGNQLPELARSLPWTTGAMLCAARHALNCGIACAPVSGFHHAHYDSGSGFCTFNGLVVSAAALLTEGLVQRVLILDCDQHFGDGTEEILGKLSLSRSVENASFGRWFRVPKHASHYLRELRKVAARFADFDLVLYQAGADVHVDDPLGGVLTTAEMLERDRIVFEAANACRTPLAWNLAGGYQEPLSKVIALHVNTMRECVHAYGLHGAAHAPQPLTEDRGHGTVR